MYSPKNCTVPSRCFASSDGMCLISSMQPGSSCENITDPTCRPPPLNEYCCFRSRDCVNPWIDMSERLFMFGYHWNTTTGPGGGIGEVQAGGTSYVRPPVPRRRALLLWLSLPSERRQCLRGRPRPVRSLFSLSRCAVAHEGVQCLRQRESAFAAREVHHGQELEQPSRHLRQIQGRRLWYGSLARSHPLPPFLFSVYSHSCARICREQQLRTGTLLDGEHGVQRPGKGARGDHSLLPTRACRIS